jgi:predicted nucleic acid-binding protein
MSQRYLLYTNVISQIMQGRDNDLLKRWTNVAVGQVAISSVTLADLE